MRVYTLLALALALLTSGRGEPNARAQDKPPEAAKVTEAVKKHLGEQTVAILSGARKVEVFRLEKQPLSKPGKDTIGMDGVQWRIKATGKELGAKFAAKLRGVLFDQATLTPSGASGARGWVAFRLWKEKKSVTVVVDFEGSSLFIVTRDAKGKQIKTALGGFLFDGKGGFDNGVRFGRVKALALEAFPKDAALKALKP